MIEIVSAKSIDWNWRGEGVLLTSQPINKNKSVWRVFPETKACGARPKITSVDTKAIGQQAKVIGARNSQVKAIGAGYSQTKEYGAQLSASQMHRQK